MTDDSRQGEKRRREETLIEDYLTEREELASGPRFHVPPFTIKRIEGTGTTYFAPVGEDPRSQLERMQGRPQEQAPAAPEPAEPKEQPRPRAPQPAPGSARPVMVRMMEPKAPKAFADLQARALQHYQNSEPPNVEPPSGEEGVEPAEEREPPEPPEPEEVPAPPPAPAKVIEATRAQVQGAVDTVTRQMEAAPERPEGAEAGAFEPARPVSFRRPFVRPDTFGTKRIGLPPLPRKVSAKELIAKLRVVREGVETHEQIIERISAAQKPPAAAGQEGAGEPEAPAAGEEAGTEETGTGPEPVPAEARGEPAELEAEPAPAEPMPGRRSEGGKLCPSCGTPISEKNRLLICTDCGRQNCDTCGRYEKSHMKSDVFYEYQFDWPLCLTCYEKAYTIQRMLGRASVCFGNGNYSYAMWYANNALSQDPESKYAPRIKDVIEKINKASKAAGERDREWRFARKQFARQPAEDPRWRQ